MTAHPPFVSVVTPVYNGAEFLAECIESVLSQSYHNLEYVIVNNCSTDGSLEVAAAYAKRDSRIKIIDNAAFLNVIDNHNVAFSAAHPNSKYCKVVSADDWIYPDCLASMVEVAEAHPSVGVVASYCINDTGVFRVDLPLRTTFATGREAGRRQLLGGALFKLPSALLYRSEMVRARQPFFPGAAPNADMDAFFRDMRDYDYGCVHQILCFARVHEKAISSSLLQFNSLLVDRIEFLVKYRDSYLTQGEFEARLQLLLEEYYQFLAERGIHLPDRYFWHYHLRRLRQIGLELDKVRLGKALLGKAADLLLNPKQTMEKLLRRLPHGSAGNSCEIGGSL